MGAEKMRPQDRWNEKAGLISKSYKLKRELTCLLYTSDAADDPRTV